MKQTPETSIEPMSSPCAVKVVNSKRTRVSYAVHAQIRDMGADLPSGPVGMKLEESGNWNDTIWIMYRCDPRSSDQFWNAARNLGPSCEARLW